MTDMPSAGKLSGQDGIPLDAGEAARSSSPRHRILYVQPGTSVFAGIERVVDTVCTELCDHYGGDFDVDVLYTSVHANAPPAPRRYRSIHRIAETRLALLRVIRETIKGGRYDLVVVPQVDITAIVWIASLGLDQGFAMHLHGNPANERSHLKAKILFFVARHFVLRHLRSVFGTSPRQLDAFARLYPSGPPRYWLPNPVRRFDLPAPAMPSQQGGVTFVTVGRFSYQKGHDILLDAFGRLIADRPQARLVLVGHGADEGRLRAQITRLGLNEAVRIEHLPDNPETALAASDVYVSTSRWEGWSLAICEALRFGLPVVATDCDFGPGDILTDGRLGTLVRPGDRDALVGAMRHYYDHIDEERRHSAHRKAHIDQYSSERIVHVHAAALKQACARG